MVSGLTGKELLILISSSTSAGVDQDDPPFSYASILDPGTTACPPLTLAAQTLRRADLSNPIPGRNGRVYRIFASVGRQSPVGYWDTVPGSVVGGNWKQKKALPNVL